MTQPPEADEPQNDDADDELRAALQPLVAGTGLSLNLLVVVDHRGNDPQVFDVSIPASLTQDLVERATAAARAAHQSELRPFIAAFEPSNYQWAYGPVPDGPLAIVDRLTTTPTLAQFSNETHIGRKNLLVLRVRDAKGDDIARLYQGLSPDPELERKRRNILVWTGDQFDTLGERPLILDENLRVLVLNQTVLVSTTSAYEKLFGASPTLRAVAQETYDKTLRVLSIAGDKDLQEACSTDINMMRKLASIQRKLAWPNYAKAMTMSALLKFIDDNSHLEVETKGSGKNRSLVFRGDPRHRWKILKLLDDDYLRSDLTSQNYEVNSKSDI